MSKPVLRVQDLAVTFSSVTGGMFRRKERVLRAVDGIGFELAEGQALGIIGESGSGKTSLAVSLMRLLPSNGRPVAAPSQDMVIGSYYLTKPSLAISDREVLVNNTKAPKSARQKADDELEKIYEDAPRFSTFAEAEMYLELEGSRFNRPVRFWVPRPADEEGEDGTGHRWQRRRIDHHSLPFVPSIWIASASRTSLVSWHPPNNAIIEVWGGM